MNIAFAGNNKIAYSVLKFIVNQGVRPKIVFFHKEPPDMFKHSLFPELDREHVVIGEDFKSEETQNMLKEMDLDYIISVHFPYIYPKEILEIPRHGALNLHPAYLPYGRGWHTPTWAIWNNTPYGATLHFMDEGLDTGDIVHQKELKYFVYETADALYQRVIKCEIEVFKEAWPELVSFTYKRKKQVCDINTLHKKKDIKQIQEIDLNEKVVAHVLLRKLRALSTNNIKEGAYIKLDEKKYRIQLRIEEE